MITSIQIKNFKKINVDIHLQVCDNVVVVGPNNSGKTSFLQAIYLWYWGLNKYFSNSKNNLKNKKRSGVAINRKDLYALPVPSLKELWNNLKVRDIADNNRKTQNIKIQIRIKGFDALNNQEWDVPLDFDYSNSEICYVKPSSSDVNIKDIELALLQKVTYLPPMSGLDTDEYLLQLGTINSFIGQGKTANVLRNLCYKVYTDHNEKWQNIVQTLQDKFFIKIHPPKLDPSNSKIDLYFTDLSNNTNLEIINAGRGFHQTLLLLTYLSLNPQSIILIDEPDAHLEILRQKDVFNYLSETCKRENSQIIISTHSEAVLDEAFQKADIISFVGTPHLIDQKRKSELKKALNEIPFNEFIIAEKQKWILYLEGSTDLNLLKAFCRVLNHPLLNYLDAPFVKEVYNDVNKAKKHFFTIKDAYPNVIGIGIFDNLGKPISSEKDFYIFMWERNEFENYIPLPDALINFFESQFNNLFDNLYLNSLKEIINEETPPAAINDKNHNFWKTTKISDDYLNRILEKFYSKHHLQRTLNKKDYYLLVEKSNPQLIESELNEKLNAIYSIISKI